jgi:hypothetical protein
VQQEQSIGVSIVAKVAEEVEKAVANVRKLRVAEVSKLT